jgi:large subunit ribosomal protein L25
MQIETLQAEVRQSGGKGSARQLRNKGLIPAVFYGPGTQPTALAVDPKALRKALGTEHGRNQVVALAIGDKKELAVVRELQIDPLKRDLQHVDFYRVELGRPIVQEVPFETKGKAAGVVAGGELRVIFRTLPVKASPEKVPAKIVVDVTNLQLNQAIQTKDLQLGEGVTVMLAPERSLVAVVAEEKRRGEEEAAAAPGAAAAPAAAGKAAPAAGAKAAPAAAKPAAPAKGGKK